MIRYSHLESQSRSSRAATLNSPGKNALLLQKFCLVDRPLCQLVLAQLTTEATAQSVARMNPGEGLGPAGRLISQRDSWTLPHASAGRPASLPMFRQRRGHVPTPVHTRQRALTSHVWVTPGTPSRASAVTAIYSIVGHQRSRVSLPGGDPVRHHLPEAHQGVTMAKPRPGGGAGLASAPRSTTPNQVALRGTPAACRDDRRGSFVTICCLYVTSAQRGPRGPLKEAPRRRWGRGGPRAS